MTANLFFFMFVCFNTVHSNLDPGQLASIFHVEQSGIIAKNGYENEKLYFQMTCSLPLPLPSPSSLLNLPNYYYTVVWPIRNDGKRI